MAPCIKRVLNAVSPGLEISSAAAYANLLQSPTTKFSSSNCLLFVLTGFWFDDFLVLITLVVSLWLFSKVLSSSTRKFTEGLIFVTLFMESFINGSKCSRIFVWMNRFGTPIFIDLLLKEINRVFLNHKLYWRMPTLSSISPRTFSQTSGCLFTLECFMRDVLKNNILKRTNS